MIGVKQKTVLLVEDFDDARIILKMLTGLVGRYARGV